MFFYYRVYEDLEKNIPEGDQIMIEYESDLEGDEGIFFTDNSTNKKYQVGVSSYLDSDFADKFCIPITREEAKMTNPLFFQALTRIGVHA